jgi:hypothetical protein
LDIPPPLSIFYIFSLSKIIFNDKTMTTTFFRITISLFLAFIILPNIASAQLKNELPKIKSVKIQMFKGGLVNGDVVERRGDTILVKVKGDVQFFDLKLVKNYTFYDQKGNIFIEKALEPPVEKRENLIPQNQPALIKSVKIQMPTGSFVNGNVVEKRGDTVLVNINGNVQFFDLKLVKDYTFYDQNGYVLNENAVDKALYADRSTLNSQLPRIKSIKIQMPNGRMVIGDVVNKNGTKVLVKMNRDSQFFDLKLVKSYTFFDQFGIVFNENKQQAYEGYRPIVKIVTIKLNDYEIAEGDFVAKRGDTLLVKINQQVRYFDVKLAKSIVYRDQYLTIIRPENLEKAIQNKLEDDQKPKKVIVETKDGSMIKGDLLDKRADTVILLIERQRVFLTVDKIKSIKLASTITPPQYPTGIVENPAAARGILTPNGMPLLKGESYYQNVWGLVYNNFGFALTNEFSLHAGFDLVGLLSGFEEGFLLGYLNLNYSKEVAKNLYIGGGMIGWLGEATDTKITVHALLSVNYGTRDHNIGLRIGRQLFNTDRRFFGGGFPFTLSAQTRFADNWSFVGELAALSPRSEFNILTLGTRFFMNRFALDFGIAGAGRIQKACETCRFNFGDDFFFGIPYLAATFAIGDRNAKMKNYQRF